MRVVGPRVNQVEDEANILRLARLVFAAKADEAAGLDDFIEDYAVVGGEDGCGKF